MGHEDDDYASAACCCPLYFEEAADQIPCELEGIVLMIWECQALHRMMELASRWEFAGVRGA
jgi:hypothetical protein